MNKQLNMSRLLILATFAIASLAGAAFAAGPVKPPAEPMNLAGVSKSAPPPVEGGVADMYMGSDKAPITIIEYASLTCSHCADFHRDVLPLLKKVYIDTGRVKYIWRHFLLSGPDLAASVIVRCAGPARFFPMIDMFYTRQAEWITPWQTVKAPNANPTLKEMALLAGMDKFVRPAGLSSEKVAQCLADDKMQQALMIERQDGLQKFEIQGTPTIIINGKKLNGNHDFETISAEIKKNL
jgi:protein-disulfide isomerase